MCYIYATYVSSYQKEKADKQKKHCQYKKSTFHFDCKMCPQDSELVEGTSSSEVYFGDIGDDGNEMVIQPWPRRWQR